MFGECLALIGRAIVSAFGYIGQIFESVGLSYVAVVSGLVILSVFLRLFARYFVGEAVADTARTFRNEMKPGKYSIGHVRRTEKSRNSGRYVGKFEKRR